MTLPDLKSLIKLLRSQGVTEYSTGKGPDHFHVKLSEEAPRSNYKKRKEVASELQDDEVPFEELSYEEQLLYSSTPPEVEPEN